MSDPLLFRKTILLVEDEADTAEMFSEMLRLSGYDVMQAYSGQSVLSLIINSKPDAVVLDVVLPDISGLEILRQIRRDPRIGHIPVVLVSGNSRPSDIEEGMMAGASVYLTKPISFWELKDALEDCFQAKWRFKRDED